MTSATIVGKVAMDPEWVEMKNGVKVLKVLVSCQTDVKGDNGYYVTDLYSCWFYSGLGKTIYERVRKGMMLCVSGRQKIRTYTNKNGEFKAGISLNAYMFDFVASADKNDIGTQIATPTSGEVVF